MANDPWGNASTAQVDKESSVDWTTEAAQVPVEEISEFNILDPFENVLIPFTIKENIQMCKDAGFKNIETVFQWANFVTFVVKK